MQREVTIPVTVVVEKRKPKSVWLNEIWLPVAVMPGTPPVDDGAELMRAGDTVRYLAGRTEIHLHAKETEAYQFNLASAEPALYVVMRPCEGAIPLALHIVTASPYEAQDYNDNGNDVVERVALPEAVHGLVAAFIDAHHVPEDFKKRKRDAGVRDEPLFGKEPIFLTRRDRMRRNGNG